MGKLLILTLAYSSDKEILDLSKIGLQAAANTFQHNLLRGLKKEYKDEIRVINCLPVGTWPKQFKKIWLNKEDCMIEGIACLNIGGLNLPFIKQVWRCIKLRKILNQVLKSDDIILIYSTYMPFLWAVKKFRNISKTLIVTDLPEYYDLQKVSSLRKMMRASLNSIIYDLLKSIDKFVLLTDDMKNPLKVCARPYVVVEGICDTNTIDLPNDSIDNKKEIVFYSGSLAYSSGIMDLVDAFRRMDNKNIELWICGKGEAAVDIEKYSKDNSNIVFFGFCSKDRVRALRGKASILINPRRSDEQFTKYSFPSKTMEYMASGIPVIMYKLQGIPTEYDNYLYYVDPFIENGLQQKIEEVISIPVFERNNRALKAKEFVITQKNEYVQSKKIIDLMMQTDN